MIIFAGRNMHNYLFNELYRYNFCTCFSGKKERRRGRRKEEEVVRVEQEDNKGVTGLQVNSKMQHQTRFIEIPKK